MSDRRPCPSRDLDPERCGVSLGDSGNRDLSGELEVNAPGQVKYEHEKWTIRIRENATGREVDYVDECGNTDGWVYVWEEGNFACDCNREDFFREASGLTEREDTDCGNERYTVLSIARPDGAVIYREQSP